jgi:2-dehydro-3-deoxyglucarate aldolase/4-hydroxy-2-oxoheptanedioate aldolase
MRGVGMMLPHDNYRPGVPAAKMAEADATRAIIIQIETREGAENAEAIAAVPGVDCLWLGHMDLSCSLGIPGRFDHPDFVEACGRVFAAAKRHGKALGRMAGGIAEAKRLAEEGYDTIALFSDTAALQERIAEGVAALRGSA